VPTIIRSDKRQRIQQKKLIRVPLKVDHQLIPPPVDIRAGNVRNDQG
jgi:hypothetical protein